MRGIPWLSWILFIALLLFQTASTNPVDTLASSDGLDSASKQVVNPNWRPLPAPAGPPFDVFLPLIARNYGQPLLMGAYPYDWAGLESTYTAEMTPFDSWTGKHHSLLGTFIDIAPASGYPADVTGQLTTIWNHGYTPFINLMAGVSAASIASGSQDAALNAWAIAYKAFVEGVTGGGSAFIAPLPEMNGNWTPYFNADPANFRSAYAHIRQVFAANNVPTGSVRWVFAPNGYSLAEDPFEEYYPGDSTTDVIGFSSYNYGFYPSYGSRWDNPSYTFGNYLPRLWAMTSTRPIIFSQTGTTAWVSAGTRNDEAKSLWLTDAFNYLALQPQVRGFIYYNTPRWEMVDWPVYGDHALIGPPGGYDGYQTGAANPAYRYIAPADLKNTPLLP